MSSKVLRGGAPGRAVPVVWRKAGAREPARAQPAAPTPRPAAAEAAAAAAAAEAARRVAELEARLEQRAREERQAGYAEGQAAGRSAAEEELRPVLGRLTRTIDELARLRPMLAAHAEADLLKLAVAIARRVLHRELSLDPEALAGIVRAALEKVQLEEVKRVRAHPEQAAVLGAVLVKSGCAVRVESDPSLERGGVVVETGRGRLDASVETQLAEIERGLTDRLRGHP